MPGAGAGAVFCELAVHVVETGCWCWCWVPGASVGAGAVSWLCTWWREVAGAGWRAPVPVLGAGCWCWCCELAVHVVETGISKNIQGRFARFALLGGILGGLLPISSSPQHLRCMQDLKPLLRSPMTSQRGLRRKRQGLGLVPTRLVGLFGW